MSCLGRGVLSETGDLDSRSRPAPYLRVARNFRVRLVGRGAGGRLVGIRAVRWASLAHGSRTPWVPMRVLRQVRRMMATNQQQHRVRRRRSLRRQRHSTTVTLRWTISLRGSRLSVLEMKAGSPPCSGIGPRIGLQTLQSPRPPRPQLPRPTCPSTMAADFNWEEQARRSMRGRLAPRGMARCTVGAACGIGGRGEGATRPSPPAPRPMAPCTAATHGSARR